MLRLTLVFLLMGFSTGMAHGQTSPAAPDTADLFAPVKAQMDARLAAAEKLRSTSTASPALIEILIGTGQVGDAVRFLPQIQGEPRETAVARANVYLTVQDFRAARPIVEGIPARPRNELTDAERQVYFDWLFAVNDMARVDTLTRGESIERGTTAPLPDLIAAGRLAYQLLDYDRARACFERVVERTAPGATSTGKGPVVDLSTYMTGTGSAAPGSREAYNQVVRAEAFLGLGQVALKLRDYDGSLKDLIEAVKLDATADGLEALNETLIRLGRTDEAITAAEWAIRFNPYHIMGHYMLGNGYARKNYTELHAAYPGAFADEAGRRQLLAADEKLANGDRSGARAAYEAICGAHSGWADALIRLASLDFEDGQFEAARDHCFRALAICPEYGRAHATLAKALESQKFVVDVHRADYERRFAESPMPNVPGIDKFVVNWKSLSERHKKRVALSIAPWKHFIPVLVEGGSTYYIKPLYMLLSETPGQETLRDQRINYDSRLWDDVRGCGGYRTVTGIEDVERTIFDQYNTVLHELTHQVHSVLTADQSREIQEHYIRAKERDDATKNGFLSRYAGGSVYEYFAEGANALESPRFDRYDPREVVRERLDAIDPDLEKLVQKFLAQTDVSASYPVAYVNAGSDRLERGEVAPALAYYRKALDRSAVEENALQSMMYTLTLKPETLPQAVDTVEHALAAHPTSGGIVTTAAEALWHAGKGLDAAVDLLRKSRPAVRSQDRYLVDLALGRYFWVRGDAPASIAAYDSVLAYQSDNPEALWGRAAALALAKRWDDAFKGYDAAVRLRTGVLDLRCDYARDLLTAGRIEAAKTQLAEALLLEAENPTAEALRGWADLAEGHVEAARDHLKKALAYGPWSDLALILSARAARAAGDPAGGEAALAPVRERIARNAPPEYIYREKLSEWRSVHELPAVERALIDDLSKP